MALEFTGPLQLGGPGEAVEQPPWLRTPPAQEALRIVQLSISVADELIQQSGQYWAHFFLAGLCRPVGGLTVAYTLMS